MDEVFIGIGGNMGDRESSIRKAVGALSESLSHVSCSRFYRTEPRDYLDQDYFLNVVVRAKTDLSPFELLQLTQSIERGGGRIRDKQIPKGPRTIDLDILLFGKQVIKTDKLEIPHPSIKDRRFVLIPLLELDAGLADPVNNILYSEYLIEAEKQGVYCSSLNDYNNLFL